MTHPTQRQNQDVFVAGGMDLPPHLLGDLDASFDAPTDPIGRRLATLLHMYPGAKSNFRQADLMNMDNPTKQKLLDSLCQALDIRKRPGNPFLPGSVVLGPVNSGLWTFSGEVSYERTGAGLA